MKEKIFLKTMMHRMKQDSVLTISALAAIISMFFTPPSMAYIDYINLPVLEMLFCLMAVVAGLRETGVLDRMQCLILRRVHRTRALAAALTALCFLTSMFITNDVALLTFVPLTMGLLLRQDEKLLIQTVVLQTIAANLGSLVTPIGNPQNLYLYTCYAMNIRDFMALTLPLGGVCLLLLLLSMLLVPQKELTLPAEKGTPRPIPLYPTLPFALLFLFCLLTVIGLVAHILCFGLLTVTLLFVDRPIFRKIDYALLGTFVCFFIFVGNLSQVDAIHQFLSRAISGQELSVSLLVSQIFSNVPAAVLLSGFTDNAKALILGTDIGGLGTLVASLASLISYRLYTSMCPTRKLQYLKTFTGYNLVFLVLLVPFGYALL